MGAHGRVPRKVEGQGARGAGQHGVEEEKGHQAGASGHATSALACAMRRRCTKAELLWPCPWRRRVASRACAESRGADARRAAAAATSCAQLKEETARLEGIHKEEKEQAKKQKQVEKEWEATREQRVGTWRDFMENKKGVDQAGGHPTVPRGRLSPSFCFAGRSSRCVSGGTSVQVCAACCCAGRLRTQARRWASSSRPRSAPTTRTSCTCGAWPRRRSCGRRRRPRRGQRAAAGARPRPTTTGAEARRLRRPFAAPALCRADAASGAECKAPLAERGRRAAATDSGRGLAARARRHLWPAAGRVERPVSVQPNAGSIPACSTNTQQTP